MSISRGFELSVVSAKGLVFDEKYRKIAENNVAYYNDHVQKLMV